MQTETETTNVEHNPKVERVVLNMKRVYEQHQKDGMMTFGGASALLEIMERCPTEIRAAVMNRFDEEVKALGA